SPCRGYGGVPHAYYNGVQGSSPAGGMGVSPILSLLFLLPLSPARGEGVGGCGVYTSQGSGVPQRRMCSCPRYSLASWCPPTRSTSRSGTSTCKTCTVCSTM